MADHEIRPAQGGLKAGVWRHFGFYKVDGNSELDKSHTICKLCHTKMKSRCILMHR